MAIEAAPRRVSVPMDEETARSLHASEEITLDGIVWGIRDATLIRIFDQGQEAPADLTGGALLHVAPSVKKRADGGYDPISVGTTTSSRMDRYTRGCLEQLGGRAIIGKGGLSDDSLEHLAEFGGVYLTIVGGAASVETVQVEAIEAVFWEDLMPECLWKFRVKDFGPLFVTMDAHGQSMYRDVRQQTARNLKDAYRSLGLT
jgi:L(+)-tartrate dehydratase beta subunit